MLSSIHSFDGRKLVFKTGFVFLIIIILSANGESTLFGNFVAEPDPQNQSLAVQLSEHTKQSGYPSFPQQGRNLLLVLIPDFSFTDARHLLDAWSPVTKHSLQLGAMSMRTAGPGRLGDQWLSLCSGRAVSGPEQWLAEEVVPHATVPEVQIPVYQLLAMQQYLPGENGGVLHHLLKQASVQTFAIGNSDLHYPRRLAPFLLANEYGETQGWIGPDMLWTDLAFPTGQRSHLPAMTEKLRSIWDTGEDSLSVLELGDISRIALKKDRAVSEGQLYHLDQLKQEWLSMLAVWMEHLQKETGKQDEIWIVSPNVSQQAADGERMAPWLILGGDKDGGFLTSSTTKQPGIVANVDFLPTLLDYFGIQKADGLVGHAVMKEEHPHWGEPQSGIITHSLKSLAKPHEQGAMEGSEEANTFYSYLQYLFVIYEQRRTIITIYLLTMITALIGTTLYWFCYRNQDGAKMIHMLIGALLLSPLFFLWLTPLIQVLPHALWILLLLGVSCFSSWLLYHSYSHVGYLTAIGLLNTFVILWDIWQGSLWMKRSFLGYDPLIGARFYGLGNEYAGILLGSSLLGMTGLLIIFSRRKNMLARKWATYKKWVFLIGAAAVYIGAIYTVGAPGLGTNAGATIAFVVAYVSSVYMLCEYRFRLRHFVPLFMLVMAVGGVFLYLHAGNDHTHVQAALQQVAEGNLQSVQQMVLRKLEMNLKLIKHSLWGKLFATSIIVLAFMSVYMKKEKVLLSDQHMWLNGFRSMIIGALIILMVNDSGIVSAASLMIYLTFPFLYLRFVDQLQRVPEQESLQEH